MAMANNYNRSVPDIIADLFQQLTHLFRKELQLARTEMSEKVGQAIGGVVMLLVGAVMLIPALVILLEAVASAIAELTTLEPYWASAIVGGATLLIGVVLALVGMNRLKADNLTPKRTLEQLHRDAAVAREQVG